MLGVRSGIELVGISCVEPISGFYILYIFCGFPRQLVIASPPYEVFILTFPFIIAELLDAINKLLSLILYDNRSRRRDYLAGQIV